MTVTDCVLEPRAGGRAVLEYRDAEGAGTARKGRVHAAEEPEHLVFDLAVLDAAGAVSFTGHYDLVARPRSRTAPGCGWACAITETAVAAVPYIAGIETGWGQVLDNLADASALRTPHGTSNGKDRS